MKHTERTILDALRQRHAPKNGGNGPEWAFVEHVRNSAGFNATRTIDAIALGLWPSRGMEMHGFEVKISRADFRREISDPAKMDAFARVLDRFWCHALACGDYDDPDPCMEPYHHRGDHRSRFGATPVQTSPDIGARR